MSGLEKEQNFDAEKSFKFKEVVDMLLVGGYFRARLSALSAFDRVVGGLAWALTASNVDADIDVVFQENSTIGQRIKLSDSIVKALVRMGCPYQLQSHQIQGLDLDRLFPVVQWLIKHVLETRIITGDLNRQFSVSQFTKHYQQFPSEIRSDSAKGYLSSTVDTYKPKRQFRKQAHSSFASSEAHVEATLLEYGEKLFSSSVLDSTGSGSGASTGAGAEAGARGRGASVAGGAGGAGSMVAAMTAKLDIGGSKATTAAEKAEAARQQSAQKEAEEKQRLAEVAESLSAVESATRVSGAQLGKIVALTSDEIRNAAEAYSEEMKRTEEDLSSISASAAGAKAAAQQHARQIENLNRQLATLDTKKEELQHLHDEVEKQSQTIESEVQDLEKFSARLEAETQKLEAQEAGASSEQKELLVRLKQLVMMHESLKKQEQKFKASCKEQLQQLQDAIKKLDMDSPDDAEVARLKEIEAIFETDSEKHAKLRQVLAKKNQEIQAVLRQIDDIPTRAELIQYERRFVELYKLVAEKLTETRKYYALYNTLDDTRTYLSREVSLLDSIHKGFPQAMSSASGKEQFLSSFKVILEGVDKTIDKVQGDLDAEKSMLELKKDGYNRLVEQQRTYFKTVKTFQDECFKNEQLQQLAEQQGAAE